MLLYTFRHDRGQYAGLKTFRQEYYPPQPEKLAVRIVAVAGGFALQLARRQINRGAPHMRYEAVAGVWLTEKEAEERGRGLMGALLPSRESRPARVSATASTLTTWPQ